MRTEKSLLRQHLTGAAMVLVAVAALAGCGGSDDYKAPPVDTTVPTPPAPPVTPPVNPPPPVSMVDTFFAYVSNLVGSMLDNDEPASIDAATVTAPENTEPEPVAVAN